jgi:iron complex outermembrane receptor protein/vitamin B12 transporter
MTAKFSLLMLANFVAANLVNAQSNHSQTANALEQGLAVEVIQVSGTRLDGTPLGAYSTLSREEIEQINPASTIDLLKRLPHVDVSENGNAGGFSYVSIRGGEFNFTLVTIDGIAVNDSTNSRGGGFDFNQINPSAIERIEVYRGGINTIYGGDAISGVINIVTRDTTAPVVTLELGTDEQLNVSATTSHRLSNNTSLLGSVSSQNKRVSSFEEIQSDQLLLKSAYATKALKLGGLATFNQSEVSGFTEDSGGELLAQPKTAETRDSEQWLVGFSGELTLNDATNLNGQLSWLNREETIDNPGIAEGVFSGIPASVVTSDYERKDVDLYATFIISPQTSMVAGANIRQQDGQNRGFLDFGFPLPVDYDFSQDTQSFYIEAKHAFDAFTVEASARYDSPDDFDNETSIRLGGSYTVDDNTRLFAVFNQGYKLPSFFALAHPLVGNSELQPERSDNFEVGFASQVSETILFEIIYFANEFTDLVDFDAELFTNVNRNKVDTSGLEFDVSAALSNNIDLIANVRYLDIDAQEGVTLRKRPNVSGNLRVDVAYKISRTSIFIDFRDNYLDSSIATGYVRLPGYASVGVSSVISLNEQLDINLNIQNALGKTLEDSVGFIEDDVEARVGVTYRF